MLFTAGLWSIYELNTISSSVQKILDDNYRSIHAAKVMKEALEREDSAILLLLLGKWKEGRSILNTADSLFNVKMNFALKNCTIPGEEEHLDIIKLKYATYKNLWERPIVDTGKEGNIIWYFGEVHHVFLSVKDAVNELINLNDRMMYETASELKNRSQRAIIPGIVAIVSALVFTLIFSYLINYYIVSPIIRITDRINKFKEKRVPFEVDIETKDEILDLSEAIEHLCVSVKNQEAKK
jgi:methyl-accepting chemotaxis protein